jgi:hypothetical protein
MAPRENEITNGKVTMKKMYRAFGYLKKIIFR